MNGKSCQLNLLHALREWTRLRAYFFEFYRYRYIDIFIHTCRHRITGMSDSHILLVKLSHKIYQRLSNNFPHSWCNHEYSQQLCSYISESEKILERRRREINFTPRCCARTKRKREGELPFSNTFCLFTVKIPHGVFLMTARLN